ncbi:amidohydrolase family protein [Sphingomonas glacialis]|uniref:amidohydrolase family protein n=1 Tax=Sphingomonas glacialis TaxID=658225 RepID=UPI001F501F8E|nr:amidohydrolase family protein [Sphingomonas glacialis]
MTRLIDAHQHFWSLATEGHEWPTAAEAAIHRDFGPDDLVVATSGLSLDGTVLVQSQPTDRDTDWMLELAARTPLVRAVVGWVDLLHPHAPERIGALARQPKLRGLRPMLQSIADTEWLLQDALTPALEAMQAADLRLDALVEPRHLPMLARFAARWPGLPIVIDHAAKPDAATMTLDPWRVDIAALGQLGLYCKLSGLRTEQAPGQPAEALTPYVEHLVKVFGARLMWGSDWPVVRLSGDDWRRWHHDAGQLAGRAGADLDQLFGGAAVAFYGLDDPRSA